MVKNHKQKEKKPFKNYRKSNKELNALIERKFQRFLKTNKKEENREGTSALSRNADFR